MSLSKMITTANIISQCYFNYTRNTFLCHNKHAAKASYASRESLEHYDYNLLLELATLYAMVTMFLKFLIFCTNDLMKSISILKQITKNMLCDH